MQDNWKEDPVEFLKMKVQHGSLIGALQGALYIIEKLEAMGEEVPLKTAVAEARDEYWKMTGEATEHIQGIVAETFNCGWMDQEPSFDWIVNDSLLQEKFPVKGDQ